MLSAKAVRVTPDSLDAFIKKGTTALSEEKEKQEDEDED